jgi:hypothetical protein
MQMPAELMTREIYSVASEPGFNLWLHCECTDCGDGSIMHPNAADCRQTVVPIFIATANEDKRKNGHVLFMRHSPPGRPSFLCAFDDKVMPTMQEKSHLKGSFTATGFDCFD